MLRLFMLFLAFVAALSSVSQTATDDRNVTIANSVRSFRFEAGSTTNPVLVKEESRRVYRCNDYRSDIPVIEFYNDMVKMDAVNILVGGSKKHSVSPRYEYYNADGIFYSDARVCYFSLPLLKQGSTSEVTIKKTVLDPLYFTRIFFAEPLFIENQEVTLTVPSWMDVEIREFNFAGHKIEKKVQQSGNATVYSYTTKDLTAVKNESFAPGAGHYVPHLLVMSKSAEPKGQKYTYFATVKDQYDWYRKLVAQVDNDELTVGEATKAIVGTIDNDDEKVKAVFQWVQNNIRYIAFEDGIMGFKPETAQEVLRKKYGDCKGMANLLTVMLRSLNLDARRAWIGTNHLPYDYSTPSLAVDNHMICAWMKDGKPVFLDATEKFIGLGEIAERIQGRQTLIEDGDNYLLERVPSVSALQNTSTEIRRLSIEGDNLKGKVAQTWKGENKDWLLFRLSTINKDKHEQAFKEYLAGSGSNYDISNLEIKNQDDHSSDLSVTYDVVWKNALTRFGKEIYVDIDNRKHFENMAINDKKRRLPYIFPFKQHTVVETFIDLPEGLSVQMLPSALLINRPDYHFKASLQSSAARVHYHNEITIQNPQLAPKEFENWNDAIKKLNEFYSQQIVLHQN